MVRGMGVLPESEEFTEDFESLSEPLLRLLPNERRALLARRGDCEQSKLGFLSHSLSSDVDPASRPEIYQTFISLNFLLMRIYNFKFSRLEIG